MTKEQALNFALNRIYDIGFSSEPEEFLEDYFAEELMVFGTTVDERFFTLDGMRTLIRHQREQSVGKDFAYEPNQIFRQFPCDGSTAVVVEEVTAKRQKIEVDSYKPFVEVCTSINGNAIVIKVLENGNGIPENIKDKIFQPFFTTKPTGQGTGLGLSLAYDIVKSHGGEINV